MMLCLPGNSVFPLLTSDGKEREPRVTQTPRGCSCACIPGCILQPGLYHCPQLPLNPLTRATGNGRLILLVKYSVWRMAVVYSLHTHTQRQTFFCTTQEQSAQLEPESSRLVNPKHCWLLKIPFKTFNINRVGPPNVQVLPRDGWHCFFNCVSSLLTCIDLLPYHLSLDTATL